MCSKGLLKRMLPFFAAFAVGLFIASFFVDIGRPRFGRGRWMRHEMRELRIENERQREEIRQLHEQLDRSRMMPSAMDAPDFDEIPMDIRVPLPPPRPVVPHAKR